MSRRSWKPRGLRWGALLLLVGNAWGQVSASAYRVWGQPDLHQRGTNIVQGSGLAGPAAIALDSRGGQLHLYIADTANSRVLAWADVTTYQTGATPTLILGQPGPQYSNPYGIGSKGFNAPVSVAVDPITGNLFVADYGNNRVLRFPSPFANPNRIEPDAVFGQPDFATLAPNSGGISNVSLNRPQGVAVDSAGNLWVADTGNNRVMRFNAGSLNNPAPVAADAVLGQNDFSSSAANRGGALSGSGFSSPTGIAFDAQDNLYVSDSNNARVLKFSAPLGPGSSSASAALVFGQASFTAGGVSGPASSSSLAGPVGVALDSTGKVYVAVPNDNRVLIFAPTGGVATGVVGQSDFTTTQANAGAFPLASANSLSGPFGVQVDGNGNLYVADTNNNRVLQFSAGSKAAFQIWGQGDFTSNGVNQIKPDGTNSPRKVAIDYSQQPFALYLSDTANHRVLVWKDAANYRSGDPADLVIGQPDLRTAVANVDTHGSAHPTSTSLWSPAGVVVDSAGNLWVADAGNNRVLRYPHPVSQIGRITADVVLGQTDMNSSAAAAISAATLHAPSGLALGPDGSLFVADSGNNRILEFAAQSGTGAAAMRVFGQGSFTSGGAPTAPTSQTLTAPGGVFVDAAFNLYVADTGANRVLVFPNTQVAPPAGTPAAFVIGQDSFSSTSGGSGTNLRQPADVALDSNGDIYIADSGDNRVLMFPSLVLLSPAGAQATAAVGQNSLSGAAPNWNSTDGLATPEGLFLPKGVYVDRRDTLYVGDAGNNRAVQFLNPVAVENLASYQPSFPVSPGGLAAMFGQGLADSQAGPVSTPWPTTIAHRQLIVNDTIPAPAFAISPTQVNFQVPSGTPVGTNRIGVRLSDTGEWIAGGTMIVGATSPGLFTLSQNGKGQAAALNQDGVTVNGAAKPASRGSVISLFGTGQGQVSPAVPDGAPAPASPPAQTVAVPTSDGKTCLTTQPSVCVAIGSSFGNIQFSGLAPSYSGLWQINVQIPPDAPTGNAVPVRVVIDGASSNVATIAIQ